MAKVKRSRGKSGYVFFKELGGAPSRAALSKTARVLIDKELLKGRVLDFGCGQGFDAAQLGWDAFDPYYRNSPVAGPYDTIVVNHVANVLTRGSRTKLFENVRELLSDAGIAYVSVARNIPVGGKAGARRRIQNYVVLTAKSIFADDEEEIYAIPKNSQFEDRTKEFEEGV